MSEKKRRYIVVQDKFRLDVHRSPVYIVRNTKGEADQVKEDLEKLNKTPLAVVEL